jgi:hypothetical protein
MRVQFRGCVKVALFIGAALSATFSVASPAAFGQDHAAAPTKTTGQSLTVDGQPDIQGIWRANPGGDTYDLTGLRPRPDFILQGDGKPRAGIHRVVDGTPDGNIPYQPWAAAKQKYSAEHVDSPSKPEDVDTQAHCLPEGPGRVFIHSGFQILQAPGYVMLWQGDSRGHWERNTLVIDVTNLKAKSRLDMVGNFYSPSAHFVERLTLVDDKTIEYEATITDPTVYTKPWKLKAHFVRRFANDGSYELYEDACHEGERSADRMPVAEDETK